MALFEEKKEQPKSFIALLNDSGEQVIAFINPAKNVPQEALVAALTDKGLNVEIREPSTEAIDFQL